MDRRLADRAPGLTAAAAAAALPAAAAPPRCRGMEVRGIDLKQPVDEETIEAIREDTTKWELVFARCMPWHAERRLFLCGPPLAVALSEWRTCSPAGCRHRLLVFRDQGVVSGERHVEISNWFGPCESTFYKVSVPLSGKGLLPGAAGARRLRRFAG